MLPKYSKYSVILRQCDMVRGQYHTYVQKMLIIGLIWEIKSNFGSLESFPRKKFHVDIKSFSRMNIPCILKDIVEHIIYTCIFGFVYKWTHDYCQFLIYPDCAVDVNCFFCFFVFLFLHCKTTSKSSIYNDTHDFVVISWNKNIF